jgi:hypothetical protein
MDSIRLSEETFQSRPDPVVLYHSPEKQEIVGLTMVFTVDYPEGFKRWEKIGVPKIYIHQGNFKEAFEHVKTRQEAMKTNLGRVQFLHLILDDPECPEGEVGSIRKDLGDRLEEELTSLGIIIHDTRFETITNVVEPPELMKYARKITRGW